MEQQTRVRIGMVNFINTAPLYEVWQQTVIQPAWRVVEAPPSVLCRMLYDNELDIGLVSSHEYGIHAAQYRLLADLSISSSGRVGSVFLFAQCDPAELDGRLVLLSSQSQTSASLVRIALEEFYGVAPVYDTGDVVARSLGPAMPAAVLAIGDDALLLRDSGRYPVQLDLGEVWQRRTGLPFVFALWVVREDFCGRYPDEVRAIHGELRRCVAQGREQLAEISRRVAPRIPMSPEDCHNYLKGIEYDLGPQKQEALSHYFGYLIKRNEAEPGALPLKIFG